MAAYACIIPTRNRPERTIRATRSVLAQTAGDFECVVVDDGSTDNTSECVAAIDDPRLRLARQSHQGVSAARNYGVELSTAPWIALLDSDDEWLPSKMERQLAYLAENPGMRICQTEEVWIRRGVRVNPMEKHRKQGGDIFGRSLELCIISPSAVVIARSLFNEIGGFDEAFPACEDYDIWLRITSREPVGLLPESLVVKYGGHADQLSRTTPVMDSWRIRAIDKILRGGTLNVSQRKAAVEELGRKCRIVAAGYRKRGREKEAVRLEALAVRHEAGDGEN